MALESCRECGEEVSTDADACPNCGAKNPTFNQKGCLGCLGVVGVVILIVYAATLWSGDGEDERRASPSSQFTCQPVPAEMIDALEEGLTAHGEAYLEGGQAVLSDSHGHVYYIATRLYGPGLDGEVLIFASNSLDPMGGLKMTANSTAEEFTDWMVGRETDARTTGSDPAARAAESCLATGQP